MSHLNTAYNIGAVHAQQDFAKHAWPWSRSAPAQAPAPRAAAAAPTAAPVQAGVGAGLPAGKPSVGGGRSILIGGNTAQGAELRRMGVLP